MCSPTYITISILLACLCGGCSSPQASREERRVASGGIGGRRQMDSLPGCLTAKEETHFRSPLPPPRYRQATARDNTGGQHLRPSTSDCHHCTLHCHTHADLCHGGFTNDADTNGARPAGSMFGNNARGEPSRPLFPCLQQAAVSCPLLHQAAVTMPRGPAMKKHSPPFVSPSVALCLAQRARKWVALPPYQPLACALPATSPSARQRPGP